MLTAEDVQHWIESHPHDEIAISVAVSRELALRLKLSFSATVGAPCSHQNLIDEATHMAEMLHEKILEIASFRVAEEEFANEAMDEYFSRRS